jgi:hypothetical protein
MTHGRHCRPDDFPVSKGVRISKRHRLWLSALVVGSLSSIAWSAPARATVAVPECWPRLEPRAYSVPANTPFRLRLLDPGTPQTLRLVREDVELGEVDVPITMAPIEGSKLTYRVVPGTLTAGAVHRFEYKQTCGSRVKEDTYRFLVSPEAPLPSTLGTISAAPMRKPDVGDAMHIDLPLTLAPGVKPWGELYTATSFVDGVPNGGGAVNVAEAAQKPLLTAVCSAYDDRVPEGRHTVKIVGTPVEGLDAPTIESNTVVVDVRCPKDGVAPDSSSDSGAGGCASGRSLPTGSEAAVGGLGILGLVFVRRRRQVD